MASEQTFPTDGADAQRSGGGIAPAPAGSRPRRLWQRSTELGREIVSLAGGLVAVLTVLLVAAIVIESLVEKTVTVRPLSVPKDLSDDGISPEVIALDLRDALGGLVDGVSRWHGIETEEVVDPEELPDVAVPSVGLSAQALAADVRAFFKIQNRTVITGEVVSRDGTYAMTLRLNGRPFFHSPQGQRRDRLDEVVAEGARATLTVTQPLFAAALDFDEGDERGAIAICDGLIGRGHGHLDRHARVLKARALRALGRVEDAIAETRTVVRLYPSAHGPRNNLGLFLGVLGRRDEAEAAFRAAIALAPRYGTAHTNLGRLLLSTGQTDAGLKELATGVSTSPDAFWPHFAEAGALRDLGRLEEALTEYRAAARLHLDRAEPHRDLGDAFRALGRGEEAAAEYGRALALDPRSAPTDRKLAAVLDELGRPGEASAERAAAEEAERGAGPRGPTAPVPRNAGGTGAPQAASGGAPRP